MAYRKVPNTLLRTMTTSRHFIPCVPWPGWIRHCHGGTMERRRVETGGHHASRCQRWGEGPWDTTVICGILWDTRGILWDEVSFLLKGCHGILLVIYLIKLYRNTIYNAMGYRWI